MLSELRIFAGHNGSGKRTVTPAFGIIGTYINADDIAASSDISVLEAAQLSDRMRVQHLMHRQSFTSETVLSSDRKLALMRDARSNGFFVRGIFVFTRSPEINVYRVKARVAAGGHDVPEDKIRQRYVKALANLPTFISLCDTCYVLDNTEQPMCIYKKHKTQELLSPTVVWPEDRIRTLVTDGHIV